MSSAYCLGATWVQIQVASYDSNWWKKRKEKKKVLIVLAEAEIPHEAIVARFLSQFLLLLFTPQPDLITLLPFFVLTL